MRACLQVDQFPPGRTKRGGRSFPPEWSPHLSPRHPSHRAAGAPRCHDRLLLDPDGFGNLAPGPILLAFKPSQIDARHRKTRVVEE